MTGPCGLGRHESVPGPLRKSGNGKTAQDSPGAPNPVQGHPKSFTRFVRPAVGPSTLLTD
jgi:hypothetical protein